MVKRRNDRPAGAALTFGEAADQIGDVLRGPARRDLLDRLEPDADPTGAFAGLRHAMRTHTLPGAAGPKSLRRVVDVLDARSRAEGLHVLHGWDFTAQRRPDDIAPVLLLDYCLRLGVPPGRARAMLAVLLDQYLLALLGVLVVRTWDDGDANANLDRVSALVADLQGSDGSGMQTVDDAESLVLLAVAYYHPEEPAYDNLLDRIRTLDDRHALRLALPCASVFGSHLRWGLRFMYRNDVGVMRDDNVVDYPWVLFALSTLMREYERIRGSGPSSARERIVCALVELLSPDPWAFAGPPPACLAAHAAEHAALRERLARYSPDLVVEFKALQPGAAYSPFGFQCNFFSNAVVALVATAIDAPDTPASLNALFQPASSRAAGSRAAGSADGAAGVTGDAMSLAARLMRYATGDPGRLAKGGVPLIVYDPHDAAHFYNVVVRTIGGMTRAP